MVRLGPLVLAASFAFAVPARADELKIGVVQVYKVMDAAPEWGKAIDDLRREFEKKKSKLEAAQESMKKKKEQIDAKRDVSDPKKLGEEESALLEEAKKFHQEFSLAQQELSRQEAGLKDSMLQRVERVVYELAEQGDYAYIFESGTDQAPNVLFATDEIDLTTKTIELYKTYYTGKALEIPKPGQKPPQQPGEDGPGGQNPKGTDK